MNIWKRVERLQIIPEPTRMVTQESQRMGSGINISIDPDFYTRGTAKKTK